MTAKRNQNDQWTFTFNKKNGVLIILGALFLSSGNPVLQKIGSTWLGISSPVSNIEEIKASTAANTEQIRLGSIRMVKMDEKLDALVIETERLRAQTANH
jgi:hypothetical protein